ncbi:uncharacterized protein C19orf18 homolog [Urocitellus parryii]
MNRSLKDVSTLKEQVLRPGPAVGSPLHVPVLTRAPSSDPAGEALRAWKASFRPSGRLAVAVMAAWGSLVLLLWVSLGCPPLLCLPQADGVPDNGGTTDLTGSEESQRLSNLSEMLAKGYSIIPSGTPATFSPAPAVIPHRPALVQVILIACVAFSIALVCGIMVSYMIHRLVKAEEKQQLAVLYENIEIPYEEVSEDESTNLLPENEKELGKFIRSVIRLKRRENIEKKKLREEQKLMKEKIKDAMYGAKMENL